MKKIIKRSSLIVASILSVATLAMPVTVHAGPQTGGPMGETNAVEVFVKMWACMCALS